MYPIVEFATGALFVASYLRFGLTAETAKWIVFICFLIVLTITDLEVRILPDVVNWPGFFTGLILSAAMPPNDGTAFILSVRLLHRLPPWHILGLLDGLLGAALGSLLLWGAAMLYKLVRGREGMGFGDVKMMALIGAFLGPRQAFLTVLGGTLLGSIVGLTTVLSLYFAGWKRQLAERAHRRNLGPVSSLRWAIVSRYQLPLGTFLGIAAIAVVFIFYQPIAVYMPRLHR
jgi:leader peptidase (prepilin peptidase)/N-methyltransferase